MNHHTPTSLISVSSTLLRPTYTTYTEDDLHDYVKVLNLLPHVSHNDGVTEAFLRKRLGIIGLHLDEKRLSAMLKELHMLGMVKQLNFGDDTHPYFMWSVRYKTHDLDAYLSGEKKFEDILHH